MQFCYLLQDPETERLKPSDIEQVLQNVFV